MCIGNRALTTAHYINKQLETLWEISADCVAKHCDGIKPSRAEIEYGTCLAQLCVGKHNRAHPHKDDLSFFATFSSPQLKFICNHEVILEFQIKSGQYRLDGRGSLALFENYTCAFRVPYHEHTITDSSYSKAKFLVLDLNAATFLRDFSKFGNGNTFGAEDVDRHHRSIVKYLSTYYLPLLNRAGFHSIYSLPDFDNLSRTHLIDFSAVSEINVGGLNIFGIEIDSVNSFLKSRWLEAASLVDELEGNHDNTSFGQIALAENRGVYEDTCFHAFFGPPQIRVLCSKEVVYYIDVHDLHFYMDGGFHGEPQYKVSNWRIALIVDVTYTEESFIRRLKLDFSKARISEGRSTFISKEIEETLLVRLRTVFVQYITRRYVTILEEYHHDHIYHVDTRVVKKVDVIEEDEYFVPDEEIVQSTGEFREHLRITETFGFDMITTVTQGSINNHLRYLWKASQGTNSCLASWAFEDFFNATFGPPQIQLPSDSRSNTVIFYVDLRGGFLKNLGPRKSRIDVEDKHDFGGWKLAFEVVLRLRDYTKAHEISDGCLKGHDNIGEYVLKQLVLDFSTAKFRQDLSRLPGLFDDSNYRLMRSKRETLLYYITRYYLSELREAGHHVLYSIPTWKKAGGSGFIRYAPSSFLYQFYPVPLKAGERIGGLFNPGQNFGNRNMLVICGMLDYNRRPPFPLPRFTWQWVPSQESFSGTVALSRSVFLEGWLLRQLSSINGRTTLVPIFHGIGNGGEWKLELVSWEKHHVDRPCNWRQAGTVDGGLNFEWSNRDEWTYAHQGDTQDIYNGGYSVSCETTNNLIVPTFSRRGTCDVKLSGKIHLKLNFTGEKKTWSTTATAQWSATLCLSGESRGKGIRVTTSRSDDISESSGFIGDFNIVHPGFKDSATLLREQLSQLTILESSMVKELESTFTGVWPLFYSGAYGYTLYNPIFNSSGDLTFELLSPLAPQGRILISDSRQDIVLPWKKRTATTFENNGITPDTSYVEEPSRTSFITSSTRVESPVPRPLQNPARAYTNAKVEYYKNISGAEGDVEAIQGVTDPARKGTKRISEARFLPEAESTVVTQRRF